MRAALLRASLREKSSAATRRAFVSARMMRATRCSPQRPTSLPRCPHRSRGAVACRAAIPMPPWVKEVRGRCHSPSPPCSAANAPRTLAPQRPSMLPFRLASDGQPGRLRFPQRARSARPTSGAAASRRQLAAAAGPALLRKRQRSEHAAHAGHAAGPARVRQGPRRGREDGGRHLAAGRRAAAPDVGPRCRRRRRQARRRQDERVPRQGRRRGEPRHSIGWASRAVRAALEERRSVRCPRSA